MDSNIRSIRARGRAILKMAGVRYATSSASRVRGWRRWSSGVTIDKPWSLDFDRLADVTPRYDHAEVRAQDLARAIAALRAAGWAVDAEGRVTYVPDGRKRTETK